MTALDRRILALAIPAAGSAMLQVVHRAVDMIFVSKLGTDAVAGLSVSSVTVWMYGALAALIGMGLTALVARYVGAGRVGAARYVAVQGLGWTLAIGLLAGIAGWFLAPWIFRLVGAAPGVAQTGESYTRIFWGGGAAILLQAAGDAIYRGHGNTRVPFLVAAFALLMNIALDPLLIFGWGPVPAMGVAGAAWATIFATLAGALLLIRSLHRHGHLSRRRPEDEQLRLLPSTP
ncbi:MAG: MATE family efflux transporter, partial [Planctomycetota bacterium]